MTKKFKRLRDCEISLVIKNDTFINPPRESQKNWLLNKALKEFLDDLINLNEVSKRFVPGMQSLLLHDRSQTNLENAEIMEDWQKPLMKAMAEVVTATHGDVLDIGFGIGASATYIQELGVKSHTIIECNDFIVQKFNGWREDYPDADIRLVHGKWQDVIDDLGTFDGIFFHTYPLNETEYVEQIVQSSTFAEHFFATAALHLKPGGIFTYLSNEIDSLSRGHQRRLFEHFSTISQSVHRPLNLPEDTKDAWWADSMVIIKAIK